MKRWLILLALVAACAHPIVRAPIPVSFGYQAPPIYALWLAEVQRCATHLATIDTSFTIERLLGSPDEVTWRLVPTEREDGTIATAHGDFYGMRIGPVGADTIILTSQVVNVARFVKHELLHVIVASPTETLPGNHGRPWGLCEYF